LHRVLIAVLNNQPQGGFVKRLPTDDVTVDGGNYWGADDLALELPA
jgi:hypothetical protein